MEKEAEQIEWVDEKSAVAVIKELTENLVIDPGPFAIIGGFAMVLYGSDRMTKDVDIISNRILQLAKAHQVGPLRQGGARFTIPIDSERKLIIDWIVRRDEAAKLFRQALKEVVLHQRTGLPIVSPEWLVILKFIAGRYKDQEDAVFLLSRENLVNRNQIKSHIIRIAGKEAWVLARPGYQRWFDLADGRLRSEQQDQAEGYIDS